ncbi:histone-lysine N-methyltransferase SETMAR [Trichonephila clavipes]|nr:histone-lysine N-methyltransferase SETMAR [Trichonephila clavipes]
MSQKFLSILFTEYMKHRYDSKNTSDYGKINIYNLPVVIKKVIGKRKDEIKGDIMTDYVGLKLKKAKNVSASDIHSQIGEVNGEEAMSRHHVTKWSRSFQSGRQDVENHNMAGSGRPNSSTTEINTAKVEEMIGGRRFSSDSAVKTSAEICLNEQGSDFYQDGLNKLVLWSDECLGFLILLLLLSYDKCREKKANGAKGMQHSSGHINDFIDIKGVMAAVGVYVEEGRSN